MVGARRNLNYELVHVLDKRSDGLGAREILDVADAELPVRTIPESVHAPSIHQNQTVPAASFHFADQLLQVFVRKLDLLRLG